MMDNFHNNHDDEFCVAIIKICFHSVQNCPLNHHMELALFYFSHPYRSWLALYISQCSKFIMCWLCWCFSSNTNGADQYFILMNTHTIDIQSHCIWIMMFLHFQHNSKVHNQWWNKALKIHLCIFP